MDDGDERHRDIIVPSIYALLCLCVFAGGVLLVLYVFFPAISRPWHPIAALILIGSPWFVWILAYIYSCVKACLPLSAAAASGDRRTPARQTTRTASTSTAADRKDGGGRTGVPPGRKQESVASSSGSEIPLAYAV